MKVYLISDTHLKHSKMKTYCDRPADFTERTHKNIMNTVKKGDLLIHLGDVGINKAEDWEWMIATWPCRKVLVRGNHDRAKSNVWWMEHGFEFACDSMKFRGALLTHEPTNKLPEDCSVNIHGHLHNIWDGFYSPERIQRDKELLGIDFTRFLKYPWQRLFALEYTNYGPVEFDKFLSHPEKYQATGPKPGRTGEKDNG
jgi:calcineurin-like phosphoesterase family protein